MINNMKRAMYLIKYGHQVTANILLGVGFLLLGIVMKGMGAIALGFDAIFLLMPAIFLSQVLYGLDYVKMVSASDLKRYITVYMADAVVDVMVLVALIVYYVLTKWRDKLFGAVTASHYYQNSLADTSTGCMMVFAAVMAFIIMCYLAGCYKYYWASTLIFCLLMMGYGTASVCIELLFQDKNISDGLGIFLAILIYLAGVLVSSVIRRLLYKVPVSGRAMGKRLGELS